LGFVWRIVRMHGALIVLILREWALLFAIVGDEDVKTVRFGRVIEVFVSRKRARSC
jgi:hypothetical protein